MQTTARMFLLALGLLGFWQNQVGGQPFSEIIGRLGKSGVMW